MGLVYLLTYMNDMNTHKEKSTKCREIHTWIMDPIGFTVYIIESLIIAPFYREYSRIYTQ